MNRTVIAVTFTLAALVATSVTTRTQTSNAKHVLVTPAKVTWAPGPPSLPPGAQAAVLEGDPAKPGAFTMRVKLPDGYKIAPHYHPAEEHVTVLQGTFVVGMGEKFDTAAGHEMTAGSFVMMPTGTRHFAWTKGETIIQLHGVGPWGLTYVSPADDPRKKPSE